MLHTLEGKIFELVDYKCEAKIEDSFCINIQNLSLRWQAVQLLVETIYCNTYIYIVSSIINVLIIVLLIEQS